LGFATLHPTCDPSQADGNRQSATVNGTTDTYQYLFGTNRLDTLTGSKTVNFDHDPQGNLVGRTYITGGPTPSAQQPEYGYAHDGRRITKTMGAEVTVYHYDLFGHLIAETDASGTQKKVYIWLEDQPLAMIGADGSLYYYHNDHLGTPQRLTDSSGSLAWSADYLPFGKADVTLVIANDKSP
jgi:YD repeat-containing protein